MSKAATDRLKARRNVAQRERSSFQPLIDEAYQYAIPYRKSTRQSGTGENRANQVFDHTAIDSAFRFAGKLQQDLWPVGQQNFELEPGPGITDPRQREQLQRILAPITKRLQAFFDDGSWDLSFHEMALDLAAGTGCMLLNPSSEPELRLWDPITVPLDETLLEGGPNGKVTGVFWDRKMPLRVAFETWPEGKWSKDLEKAFKDKPEDEIVIHCDTVWQPRKGNAKAGRWVMTIWCDKQDETIFESRSRTCPWLTPRYIRVSGEVYGRGLVMMAMPSIKTANTAKRLLLQSAAISMLGIYTAVDDGVFNPDLSPVQPGQFWKVARNGGPLGKSVERFPDPRLDMQQLVMQDLQAGVKATMMDDELPLAGEAVKSPTEIIERVRKARSNHIGAFGRMVTEIVVAAVMRAIELAYDMGLIQMNVSIDQLLVRVKVKSPLAVARAAARVQNDLEWLQIVIGVETAKMAAPGVQRIAHTDPLLANAGRELGVDPAYVVTTDEREEIDKKMAEAAAAQAALAVATGGKPAA